MAADGGAPRADGTKSSQAPWSRDGRRCSSRDSPEKMRWDANGLSVNDRVIVKLGEGLTGIR